MFSAISAVAGAVGASVDAEPENDAWYRASAKSRLTPPGAVFGLVWPVLYALGSWSAARVAGAPAGRERSAALGLWAAQIGCNAAWTPTFFGAHRPRAAMAILVANALTLGGYAYCARKIDARAALAVVPNLAWLVFAGVLNARFIAKNAPERGAMPATP